MFKNIIFDWGGVIKDADKSHFWIVGQMLKYLGKEMSVEEIRKAWTEPYMSFWNKFFPDLTHEDEVKLYKKFIMSHDCPEPAVCEGMPDLIKKLKNKGIKMIVLTTDLPDSVLPEIKKFGLENVFDNLITAVKDKAENINEIMEENNFISGETVFVGDANRDIEAGKVAGIKTIAVLWGVFSEEKLKAVNPDYLVHNIKELEEILLK
jgi:phosphoglycolate phosphatase-like HAD superfamily hydrolase